MSLVVDGVIGRDMFSHRVSLRVEPGETIGIVGRNGSGKSTLLHTVAGLCELRSGSLSMGGRVWDAPADRKFVVAEQRECAVVFQDLRLFPHMTCLENVAFGLRCSGTGRSEATELATAQLENVGAKSVMHRKPSAISGGQAQRVALARALVMRPQVLLLDEPLSAIDAGSRLELRDLVGEVLAGFPGVCLYVSHAEDDLRGVVSRIHRLD